MTIRRGTKVTAGGQGCPAKQAARSTGGDDVGDLLGYLNQLRAVRQQADGIQLKGCLVEVTGLKGKATASFAVADGDRGGLDLQVPAKAVRRGSRGFNTSLLGEALQQLVHGIAEHHHLLLLEPHRYLAVG